MPAGPTSSSGSSKHGANDNYRNKKDKTKMGREPGLDEDFMVFEPGGAKVHVPNLTELKTYYTDHGINWPYKNP